MKYLTDYANDRINATLDKYGAFFAFSNQQYEAKAVKGVKYGQLRTGLIVPVEHAEAVRDGLDAAWKAAIAQDVAENGKEMIIRRELSNYECYYVGDITDCVEAVKKYGYTEEDVLKVYRENYEEASQNF